jgi:DNA (cytosine-5)-methyltransferase 1
VADWRLLQASDYGVPQLRPRLVLVALRPADFAYFSWPEAHPEDTATVGQTLRDLMAANGWPGAAAWAARASDIVPTIVGGSKKHGGADLGPTRAKRAWRALGVDALGVADAAPPADAPRTLLPRLTCAMVARIQGWDGPEYQWEFTGRKTSNYRQIGNAFPPRRWPARSPGSSAAPSTTQASPATWSSGRRPYTTRSTRCSATTAGSSAWTRSCAASASR